MSEIEDVTTSQVNEESGDKTDEEITEAEKVLDDNAGENVEDSDESKPEDEKVKNKEDVDEDLGKTEAVERGEGDTVKEEHFLKKDLNQAIETNFDDFSAMTIEELDTFLHENEEETYEEEDGRQDEEEEEGDECEEEEESEEPRSHEEVSRDSGEDRVRSEFLNADNPLMAKFQAILKIHLLGEIAKLRDDLGDLEDRYEKDLTAFRSEGEHLERIATQKRMSEKKIEDLREALDERKKEREAMGEEHAMMKRRCEEEREKMEMVEKNYQALILKTENLSRTAQQMEGLETKRQSELSIARIQSAKSAKEVENLLSNDLKQDILSLMINRDINKLERSLAECEAQYIAKHAEMKTLLERVGDARADLSSMEKENKKIDEAWNRIVAAIQGKQKEYLDAQEEARTVREKLRELEISTVNTRKQWNAEKYNGEKITGEVNRFMSDVGKLRRAIERKEAIKGTLERQILTLSKIVARNEAHIGEFTRLEAKMTKELQALTAACDGMARLTVQFEHDILEKYQTDFVVNNKGMAALTEDIRRLKRHNADLELEIAALDQKLSAARLDMDRLQGENHAAVAALNTTKKEVAAKIRQIEMIEQKVERVKSRTKVLGVKILQETQTLDTLKRDLEENSKSPTQKMAEKLKMEIDQMCASLKELKSQWLRKQSKLIDLMEEHNGNLREINELECSNHEYGYKLNKQCRAVEEKIQEHDKLKMSVERLVRRMDREMAKSVHTKDFEVVLNHQNAMRQNMYFNQLQDAEKELYGLRQSILELEAEERSYLREIQSAESDYLSWDKKCTMAAKEKEKYEMEKKPGGEIEQLKKEIHRMEMRFAQLRNVQKKLMNDLEACVTRRERIMDNVRARTKRNTKEDTKKYIHVKKVQQLRTQVKQVQGEMKSLEKLAEEYKARKEDLINENTNKQNQLKSLQENIDKVEKQLQEGYLHKQKNLEILIRKQRRCRHYCQLKDGKYRPLFRSEASLELETIKQTDTNGSLVSLLETLLGDFPSLQYSFRKILNTLKLN